MADYERQRSTLQTGDLVLFSGKGGISDWIKLVTASDWSHVGLVVRVPEWDAVLLWESTTLSNLTDLETGRLNRGPQLVLLSQRVGSYNGRVAIRRLEQVERDEAFVGALRDLRLQLRGRAYEQNTLELVRAAYDGPLGANIEDLSSVFCSELVAEAYQRWGLLAEPPAGKPSNEYTPADFSIRRGLRLCRGRLGQEIVIRHPAS